MTTHPFQFVCRATAPIRSALRRMGASVVAITTLSAVCAAQTASLVPPPPPNALAMAPVASITNSIIRIAAGNDTLHVVVGRSLFLNTKSRLRRVYVADPTILNSVTLSPNQIIVTAMTPGISSLVLLDETGAAQSYAISSDLDVQGLRSALASAVPADVVAVEGSGNHITLSGRVTSAASADTAMKLAALYSKDVANSMIVAPEHPKQVRLKVRILEVDRSKLSQFGVNLFNPGGNTSFLAATTTAQFPSTATLAPSSTPGAAVSTTNGSLTTSNPLNFLLYSAKLNLGVTIQDLESKQVLQILAEPTITTISGQRANFLAGGEFPFPVIQPGGGAGTSASVTIQFRPYGVKLDFTPIVNDDGTIRLKVAPEVSALDYTNAVNISGYTIPALSTRRAETEVELRSSQSFAISGLLDQRTTDILSKTPGIASIPILGALFKSKNINHSTTELVVVVTPTLVDPLTEATDPAEPGLPIPTLPINKFDKSLGSRRNPNPAVPPIDPSQPTPFGPAKGPAAETQQAPQTAPTADAAPAAQPIAPAAASEGVSPAPVEATITNASMIPPASAGRNTAATALPSTNDSTLERPPQPTPPPAPPPTMVQIMALSHKEDAATMVSALKRRGYSVAVAQDPRDSLLHLQLGPFASRSDAEAMQQKLLSDGYNATVK